MTLRFCAISVCKTLNKTCLRVRNMMTVSLIKYVGMLMLTVDLSYACRLLSYSSASPY